jgi:hypothetical protein
LLYNIQQMTTEKTKKNEKKYICEKCNFITVKKTDYNRHISTLKHKNTTNNTTFTTPKNENKNFLKDYICECGKSYAYRGSLYNHKKACNFLENGTINYMKNDENNDKISINDNVPRISQEQIIKLIEKNVELTNNLKEAHNAITNLIPKLGTTTNNTTNNTTTNNLNINVFLNEQCKHAINMSDFIKSIEVSMEQLDFTKSEGLAAGLSKMIIDNMNKLSLYERPLHCTDMKRETLYIKEDNKWGKDSDKSKIKRAIKKASGKNYHALQVWKDENPDFENSEDKQEYFAHTISTIGKPTDNVDDKVIKNLCKDVYVKDSIKTIDN